MKNPYAVLGLTPDADDVVVRAAWKALIAKFHPDFTHDPATAARATEINEAYALLSDPERRAALHPGRRPQQPAISALGVRSDMPAAALQSSYGAPARHSLGRRIADLGFVAALLATTGATGAAVLWSQSAPDTAIERLQNQFAWSAADRPAASRTGRPGHEHDQVGPTPTIRSALDEIAALAPSAQTAAIAATNPEPTDQVSFGRRQYGLVRERSGEAGARAYRAHCDQVRKAAEDAEARAFCTGFTQAMQESQP